MYGSLNPYCNGRKNRIFLVSWCNRKHTSVVLILIVMEERIGWIATSSNLRSMPSRVLILIVMEERIGLLGSASKSKVKSS